MRALLISMVVVMSMACATEPAPTPSRAPTVPPRSITRVSVQVVAADGSPVDEGTMELVRPGQRSPLAAGDLADRRLTVEARGFAWLRLRVAEAPLYDVAVLLSGRPIDLTIRLAVRPAVRPAGRAAVGPAERDGATASTRDIEFRRPQSTSAQVAQIVASYDRQRRLRAAGPTSEDQDVELARWRTVLARIALQTRSEPVRDTARIALLGLLGLGPSDPWLLRRHAGRALVEIRPSDPLWSIAPDALTRALATVGPTEAAIDYAQRAISEQPDDAAVATLLAWRLREAEAVGDETAAAATRAWLMRPRFEGAAARTAAGIEN